MNMNSTPNDDIIISLKLTSSETENRRKTLVDLPLHYARRCAGQPGCRRRAALEERSGLGVDGGAAVVVAGRQQALAALCLHQVARLDVCNRAPSSCLCHVTVRDRFAGFSSSVLCWSGFERSNTMRKLLRMILCVPVTPSNTSSVPPAITGPRAPIQGARSIFWPK